MDVGRKRFQSLDGRVDVGGLVVVVVVDTSDPGDEFKTMLDGFEVRDCLANLRRLAADERADRNSRENILQVVRAFEGNLCDLHDLLLALAITKEDAAVANIAAPAHFFLAAEPDNLRMNAIRKRGGCGVIGVQHCEVVSSLILEDARLRLDVIFEGLMTVEMIGRNV